MTKREAYRMGRDEGYSIVSKMEDLPPTDECCGECDDVCQCPNACAECLTREASECEQNARQMASSPFCTGAFRTDPERDPDGWRMEELFDAYDAGVAAGIKRGVRERLAHA